MRNTTCHQVTPLMTLPCCFERAGIRPPLAPHSSVSSSHRQLPLLLEPDSNLEITETLASAPAHQLQMPAFVGWRRLAAPDRFGASTKPLLVVR